MKVEWLHDNNAFYDVFRAISKRSRWFLWKCCFYVWWS